MKGQYELLGQISSRKKIHQLIQGSTEFECAHADGFGDSMDKSTEPFSPLFHKHCRSELTF